MTVELCLTLFLKSMFCIFLVTAAAAATGGRQHQVKHGPSSSYTLELLAA
jgi:hypothetical protein